MNTRQITHEARLRQWMEVMQRRQASGLSIKAWCQTNGISRQQYFYWQRRLREPTSRELMDQAPASDTALAPSGWARLEAAAAESAIMVEINGCCVQVSADTDPALLGQVCRMLKGL